jgi:hypothetical protein
MRGGLGNYQIGHQYKGGKQEDQGIHGIHGAMR